MKEKGILLPIFSLPSKYGIGDFGYEAYEFIDILSENGIQYWEILPINSSDNLPYSPISYYALEEDYISLEKLKEMNLLDEIETKKYTERIVYDSFKMKYYKKAYEKFEPNEDFFKFKANLKILEYAKFVNKNYKYEEDFIVFLQYILDKQWNELKEYANSKNVKIVGDMPIYPAYNSCEVEYNPYCFELNNGKMEFISGTPPDEYNEKGQKWWNPVYNFEYIKQNNFTYLLERYKEYLKRFDIVRIDHFRAYDSYYKIPIKGEPCDGMYTNGPSYPFFDELLKISSSSDYWVEDLGDIRKETKQLKEHYNFIGQNISIHSIKPEKGSDIGFEKKNIVNYTSNHDSDTSVGLYKEMNMKQKMKLRKYFKSKGCNSLKINEALMQYCMKSNAEIIVVPVQDILGLDNNSRINLPGVDSSQNWSWKLENFDDFKKKIKYFSKLK